MSALAILELRGQADQVRNRAIEILEDANEDANAFRVTSSCVVVTAARG